MELKPCPFCGSPAAIGFRVAYSTDSSYNYVGCTSNKCDAQMPFGDSDSSKDFATTAWNTRTETKGAG